MQNFYLLPIQAWNFEIKSVQFKFITFFRNFNFIGHPICVGYPKKSCIPRYLKAIFLNNLNIDEDISI